MIDLRKRSGDTFSERSAGSQNDSRETINQLLIRATIYEMPKL